MKDLLHSSSILAIYAFLTAYLTSLTVEDLDITESFIFLFVLLNSGYAVIIFIEYILKKVKIDE